MANKQLKDQKKYSWDLSPLYKSTEDPAFKKDYAHVSELAKQAAELTARLNSEGSGAVVAETVAFLDEALSELRKPGAFLSLSQSAVTTNTQYSALFNQLMLAVNPLKVLQVALSECIDKTEDLDALIKEEELEDYDFVLHEMKRQAHFRLSQELEALAAKLQLSGGSAWSDMVSYLTSTLEVEREDGSVNLSDIRNLAYDEDPAVRKAAYEDELKAYKKIEKPMAFALNSIKSEVNLMAAERGYDSALDEALTASRLKKESLDSMLAVMKESFPEFRRYFKAKAKLLGHEEKLPFYDLFAPVGRAKGDYSIEEAQAKLLECFHDLSPEIEALMKRAFDEGWIDYLPRAGKVGGAFCANLPEIGQSRVLTNFDGSFNSLSTLAHELGHAYHGSCIEDHRPLNRSYSMPVAETASTFNETHLTLWALEHSKDDEEKLAVLEQFISGTAQTIVDISSRYLFEKEVFERCSKEFLDAEALKDIMIRAQQATYGDAMPDDCRHPYMWICKSHYYSPNLSYYNFPYAFGQLFSMGLYRMYQKEGAPFMKKYRELLHATTVAECEEVAAKVGVDLTGRAFWQQGMEAFSEMIERYCELAEKLSR